MKTKFKTPKRVSIIAKDMLSNPLYTKNRTLDKSKKAPYSRKEKFKSGDKSPDFSFV